jgi:hypothetical protein
MPASYDGALLDHLAKHIVYLSMLAAAAEVVVVVIVVGTVIVAVVIIPVAVVTLAFVLCRPLILLLRQLVVASCFSSVAGIFTARPTFGCLLCLPRIAMVKRQMTTPRITEVAQRKMATPIAKVGWQMTLPRIPVAERLKTMHPATTTTTATTLTTALASTLATALATTLRLHPCHRHHHRPYPTQC